MTTPLGMLLNNPLLFVFWAISLLLAISFHEAAHAYTADRLGDPTPRSQGRLTLNPLVHLSPIGTITLLLIGFGWGKPVQFDPFNLKNPRRDSALISIAGPATNLVLATLAGLVSRLLPFHLAPALYPFVFLNVMLAIFNLIPIHPLDGSKIAIGILPIEIAREYQQIMQRYGTLILLLMLLPFSGTSPVISLVQPVVRFIINLILPNANFV